MPKEKSKAKKYRVKVSARASRVILRVSSREGLVVVVPQGYDHRRIPHIITQKEDWINKAMDRIRRQKRERDSTLDETYPAKICLNASGEEFRVIYRPTTDKNVSVKENAEMNCVVVYGRITDKDKVYKALQEWLGEKADYTLRRMIKRVAMQTGLNYSEVFIRNQNARWGSCTAENQILLNRKLMFLPEELTEYIMIHELCHTVHLDHSPRFWKLVQRHAGKDALEKEKIIRYRAWPEFVPSWAEHR